MKKPIALDLSLAIPAERYSMEKSVALIHQIHIQLESVEDYRL